MERDIWRKMGLREKIEGRREIEQRLEKGIRMEGGGKMRRRRRK